MAIKDKLKTGLFPTIWCPGCGIGLIMQQLASVMDDLGLTKDNTVLITGIGCTGRMGAYMNFESVYTLHGRTLPVAEAVKAVRPELNVIVVSGDGDTASIGGNHLLHSIRRNSNLTVLCNNNEIYGLTGGQTGPTTPQGTTTLSSPAGAAYSPINLQGLVNTNPNAFYARTTVYHQGPMRASRSSTSPASASRTTAGGSGSAAPTRCSSTTRPHTSRERATPRIWSRTSSG
jgi:2-oxoglutarate ferredoxin oxidoreductase subunit beta